MSVRLDQSNVSVDQAAALAEEAFVSGNAHEPTTSHP